MKRFFQSPKCLFFHIAIFSCFLFYLLWKKKNSIEKVFPNNCFLLLCRKNFCVTVQLCSGENKKQTFSRSELNWKGKEENSWIFFFIFSIFLLLFLKQIHYGKFCVFVWRAKQQQWWYQWKDWMIDPCYTWRSARGMS